MQQIEEAVLISFAGSHVGVDQHVKDKAESYLAACKREAAHCSTCISLLESTTKPEVQFWCLKSVLEVVTSESFGNAQQQEIELIKGAATKWAFAEDGVALRAAPFVQNKLAQLLAALASLYPDKWPNFFSDMLVARSHNPVHANMFTRVLLALDADIISLDIPRSDAESRRSMAFKDAMRERDVGPVVHACVEMVAQQHRDAPHLVIMVLSVLQRYADWVDIHLVVTQDFVSLLYQLLRGGGQHGSLQGAAAATLASVLSKRMEPQPKLQLIVQLDAAAAVEQWESIATPAGELDEELAEQLTSLLNVLACETIESVKRIENQVISMQALGVEVNADASGEVSEALAVGQRLLAKVMPPVLRTLAYEHSTVCLSCMAYLNSFLARVRNVYKRQGGLDETSQQQLLMIMQGLAVAARYPRGSVSRAGVPASEEEALQAEEQEKETEEARQELFVLLRNTSKLIPKQAIASVHTLLQTFISPADDRSEGALPADAADLPAWQDVEVAVVLLYALGEALTDEVNADRCGEFAAPVALLMSGTVPHLEHRHVAGAVLECCVRYVKVASQNPELVLPVMKTFLGSSGLSHPHSAHATRACYLFMRTVKVLRPQLHSHLEELIQGLIPAVMAIVANPIQTASHALKATVARGAPGSTLQLDDRLYAWEAMGLLLATDTVPQDAQASYVQGLLQQLCTQIRSSLETDTSVIAIMGSSPPPRPNVRSCAWGAPRAIPPEAMRINHALEAVSRLSKGFSLERMTRLRPKIGELFLEVVPVALLVPTKLPKNKLLRARFISYLHRMVECLGGQLLPMLPQTLAALLHRECDVWDLCSALRVVSQLVLKFPGDVAPLLKELMPSIIFKVHEMLPESWDWTGAAAAAQSSADGGRTGSTSEILELSDLQNTYFALLSSVVANDLLSVVPQGEALNHAMATFVQGASSHIDISQRKLCVAALVRLLKVWGGEAGFKQYAIDSVGIQCCVLGMLSGGVDVRDGGVLGLLTEVAAGLKALHAMYGDEFMAALKRCMEQDTKRAQKESTLEKWMVLLHSVQTEDAKQIKDAMKALMRDKQGVVSRIPQHSAIAAS